MSADTRERLARKIIYYQNQNSALLKETEKMRGIVDFNSLRKKELTDALAKSERILKTLRH